ncbi:hypothetical protein BDQ17DRAFT_1257543 [Cyathus striatus]|nr:hypothetical protein BDQ17DRAFT_1257562 [Cyathus striatus]KAF8988675.1 hypothetical protein BDQ17DRAFT_1257543 [Cyathus striatus]
MGRVIGYFVQGNNWKKLTSPAVERGGTALPLTEKDKQNIGIRFDYDGEITGEDGITYHKFEVQPNAGKVDPAIKKFRNKYGTHAVIANAYVKKDGRKEDVEDALQVVLDAVKDL